MKNEAIDQRKCRTFVQTYCMFDYLQYFYTANKRIAEMNAEESKNRFISSSEAEEKCRSAYYKLLESAREGNMVCIRRGVYAKNGTVG